ncbi:MAG: transcription-repair coupling factor [Fidelibacterota bacterium]
MKDLEGFPWGGHVVHEDFGIGLYRGLTRINTKSGPHECVSIEFQGGDLVHVPLERLNRVHNYVGSSRKPPTLSSLRSARWEQAKRQTRRSAERVVDDFIRLYSERHAARGTSFSADASLHQALRASFPYEETRHQLKAYEEIRKDMESSKPMDRLLCGDVGFGKTEVAIRAAFKAVYDQKQVAVLTPTTILASQHFVTFKARLNDLGVNVALLSRFTTPVRQRQVIHELKERRVDVIVGTHRLLSRDIRIPELGFLIIDEEHRFGARHKEALKKLRTSVDVLSMSATPIPRTLQFSLLGIRDISTITIPPRERLPIITRVLPFDDECIRNGITFEVERGGQVFFVHNDVRTINPVAGRLRLLLPGLRVGVAHGQLPGRKLEEVMLAFLNKDIDVLVCTTIVEAGIDLPNVNTIFIDSAHHFGLSQIYQMRGRVGRSTRQAYCYLFCPASKKLTHQAHDRLKAIEYFSALGSGYAIALKDLELRGAGNLFGVEQSGHISSVGFHLYCKIVEEAARRRLNHGPAKIETSPVRMTFEGHATIPPDYIPNVADRLYVYRRIARARHRKDIDDIKGEMGDRFGSLPQEVIHLLGVASIQVSARGSGLTQLTISSHELRGSFDPGVGVRFLRKFTRVLQDTLSARDLSFRLSTPATGGPGFSVTTGSAQEAFQAAQYLFESFPSSPNFTRQDSNSDTTT